MKIYKCNTPYEILNVINEFVLIEHLTNGKKIIFK